MPLNKSIEGIENVAFNDFTIGVDVTGETPGQQHLPVVRQPDADAWSRTP